ncbi:hypothetical protein FWD07_01975 [Candidatus Saccharibacteria bacterium]|nr:hypothetical protein [Candidatus Saccharibacteria bacterium]
MDFVLGIFGNSKRKKGLKRSEERLMRRFGLYFYRNSETPYWSLKLSSGEAAEGSEKAVVDLDLLDVLGVKRKVLVESALDLEPEFSLPEKGGEGICQAVYAIEVYGFRRKRGKTILNGRQCVDDGNKSIKEHIINTAMLTSYNMTVALLVVTERFAYDEEGTITGRPGAELEILQIRPWKFDFKQWVADMCDERWARERYRDYYGEDINTAISGAG